MLYAAPSPYIATVTQASQQQPAVSDLDQLARGDFSPAYGSAYLRHYIDGIVAKNEGLGVTTDVSVIDLQTHKALYGHNLDTEQFAASVNKLPIAALVLRDVRAGKLQWNQVLTWSLSDQRGGAGVYDQTNAPMQATVHDLLYDMLNRSGNTAPRILVNQGMGGAAVANVRIKNELGLQHTYFQPLDANRFYLGNSTARDSINVMEQLLTGNDQYSAFVKDALATNIYTDYGVRSQLAGNDYIVLANKVGILDDADGNNRHDVGIIYNTKTKRSYGYSFMTTAPGASYSTATSQAGISVADMGKGLLQLAGDKQQATQKQPRHHNAQNFVPERRMTY